MKILCYNIYNCLEESREFSALVDCCTGLETETVLLNEFRKNEDGQTLTRALHDAGFTHHVIGRSGDSPGGRLNCCAIFSRNRLTVQSNTESLRMISVWQEERLIVSYHAAPNGVASVLDELPAVEEAVRSQPDVLLAGDFNSLARQDAHKLEYRSAGDQLERYLDGGSISFEAIDRLLALGLRDLNVDPDPSTVPTTIGRKWEAGVRLRLDYALGKGAMESLKSGILRGSPYDSLSDHYPLLVYNRE